MRTPNAAHVVHFNNGHKSMEAFCCVLKPHDVNDKESAFIADNVEPSSLNLMKKFASNEGMKEFLKLFYHCRYLFNHPSLIVMHSLEKQVKTRSNILLIKCTHPCHSCLFGCAHRKKSRKQNQKKHVEEIEAWRKMISRLNCYFLPRLTKKVSGNSTNQKHVESQLIIYYYSNLMRMHHLEGFATESTLKENKIMNDVLLHGASQSRNARHAISDFLI